MIILLISSNDSININEDIVCVLLVLLLLLM